MFALPKHLSDFQVGFNDNKFRTFGLDQNAIGTSCKRKAGTSKHQVSVVRRTDRTVKKVDDKTNLANYCGLRVCDGLANQTRL